MIRMKLKSPVGNDRVFLASKKSATTSRTEGMRKAPRLGRSSDLLVIADFLNLNSDGSQLDDSEKLFLSYPMQWTII